MMPLEFVGCIGGCDETLREVLNLKYLRPGAGGGDRAAPGGQSAPRQQNQPRGQPGPRARADSSRPPAPRPRAENGRPSVPPPPAPDWSTQPPAAVHNNATVCNCGQDALLLTVRKEGPNQGRQFYKCNTGNCNFFLWADQQGDQGPGQAAGRNPPPRPPPQPPRPSFGSFSNMNQGFRNGGPGGGGGGGDGGETMCNCNEPAVSRTVMKDGPNKGRVFHTCGKPREQQCGFFQWGDENVPPGMTLLCLKHQSISLQAVYRCK